MVFVIILLALVLYSLLYLLWQAFGDRVGALAPFVNSINNVLFVSDDVIFVIFRGLVFISLAYVIVDFFVSHARRRAKRKKREAENTAARTTVPPL